MNAPYILNSVIFPHRLAPASEPEACPRLKQYRMFTFLINSTERRAECLFDRTVLPFQLLSDVSRRPQKWAEHSQAEDFSLSVQCF